MIPTLVQDPPAGGGYQRRATDLRDGSEIAVSSAIFGDSESASIALYSPTAVVQVSANLTRDELVEHRDAINAVLAATEPAA